MPLLSTKLPAKLSQVPSPPYTMRHLSTEHITTLEPIRTGICYYIAPSDMYEQPTHRESQRAVRVFAPVLDVVNDARVHHSHFRASSLHTISTISSTVLPLSPLPRPISRKSFTQFPPIPSSRSLQSCLIRWIPLRILERLTVMARPSRTPPPTSPQLRCAML